MICGLLCSRLGNLFRSFKKKGDLEIEEVIKVIIIILVITVVVWGISFLFLGKGERVFSSIKDLFMFGK